MKRSFDFAGEGSACVRRVTSYTPGLSRGAVGDSMVLQGSSVVTTRVWGGRSLLSR